MECTLLFDPVQYIYLNPELNLRTVEDALTHYTSNPDSGLHTDLDLPPTFSPKVYGAYAKELIDAPGWMDEPVRVALVESDRERLAVVHYMRTQPADAVFAVDPAFNDALFRMLYQADIAFAGPCSREDLFLLYLHRKRSGQATTAIGNVDEVVVRLREEAQFVNLSVGGSLFAGTIVADNLLLSCSPAAYPATSAYFAAKAQESLAHAADVGFRTPGALLAPDANVFSAPTYFVNDVIFGGRTLAMCEDYIASNVSNIVGPLRVANHLHVEDDLFVAGTLTANTLKIPYKGSANLHLAAPARAALAQRGSATLAECVETAGAVLGADASIFTKPVFFTDDVFFGDNVLTLCADFIESNITNVVNDVHFAGNVHVTSTLRAGVIAANAIRLDCTTADTVPEAAAILSYLSNAESSKVESLVVPGLGALTPAGALFDGPVVFRGDVVFGRNVTGGGGQGSGCCGGGSDLYTTEGIDARFPGDVHVGGILTASGLRIHASPDSESTKSHMSVAAAILEEGGMDCGSFIIGNDAVVFTKPVYFTKDLVLAETPLEFSRRLSVGTNATNVTGDLNVGGIVRASRLDLEISPLDDQTRALVERADDLRDHPPPGFEGMIERGFVMDEDGSVVFTGRVLFTQPVTFGSAAVAAGEPRQNAGSAGAGTGTTFEENVEYHVRYQSNLSVRGTLTVSALRINCGNMDYDPDTAQERADDLVREVAAWPDASTRCAKLETGVAEVKGAAVFHGPVVFRDSVFFDTTAAFESSDRDEWWGRLEHMVLSVANAAVGCGTHCGPGGGEGTGVGSADGVVSAGNLHVEDAVISRLSVGTAHFDETDVSMLSVANARFHNADVSHVSVATARIDSAYAARLSVATTDIENARISKLSAGTAHFGGAACFEGPVCVSGPLTVSSRATFQDGLHVEYGNAVIHNDLVVDKSVRIGDTLTAHGGISTSTAVVATTLSVGGDLYVGGTLRVDAIELTQGGSVTLIGGGGNQTGDVVGLEQIGYPSVSTLINSTESMPSNTSVVTFEGGLRLPGAAFSDQAVVFNVPCIFREPIYMYSNIIYNIIEDIQARIKALEIASTD